MIAFIDEYRAEFGGEPSRRHAVGTDGEPDPARTIGRAPRDAEPLPEIQRAWPETFQVWGAQGLAAAKARRLRCRAGRPGAGLTQAAGPRDVMRGPRRRGRPGRTRRCQARGTRRTASSGPRRRTGSGVDHRGAIAPSPTGEDFTHVSPRQGVVPSGPCPRTGAGQDPSVAIDASADRSVGWRASRWLRCGPGSCSMRSRRPCESGARARIRFLTRVADLDTSPCARPSATPRPGWTGLSAVSTTIATRPSRRRSSARSKTRSSLASVTGGRRMRWNGRP